QGINATSIAKPSPTVQLAIGTGDYASLFVNFFKIAGSTGTNPNLNGQLPTILNSDGYPTTTPSARISFSLPSGSVPVCTVSAPCDVGWRGTGGLLLAAGTTTVSDPHGCAIASGYFGGPNCAVQFYWTGGT